MAAFVKRIVTGYVPISGHPRTAKEYGELGENLFGKLDCVGGDFVINRFMERVEDTWLWKLLHSPGADKVSHSVADNPQKNSLAYHCVQHQKFGWLLKTLMTGDGDKVDTFVWMDYGIGHVPGVTPEVVNEFMASVKPNDFAIPGCWDDKAMAINDYFPCWRFCGGLMVVPRAWVYPLYTAIKQTMRAHLRRTRNVPWEVNTLAEAEQYLRPHLRWYSADHNQTMFTNYGASHGQPRELAGSPNCAV